MFVGLISKYVPNKVITCNDKDDPWITPKYSHKYSQEILYSHQVHPWLG